jgi:hypothetical protein
MCGHGAPRWQERHGTPYTLNPQFKCRAKLIGPGHSKVASHQAAFFSTNPAFETLILIVHDLYFGFQMQHNFEFQNFEF